jgi:hypothetical protein
METDGTTRVVVPKSPERCLRNQSDVAYQCLAVVAVLTLGYVAANALDAALATCPADA